MNITHETSREALIKYNSSDKRQIHYKIILNALKHCEYPLTGYGIAQRTKLSYHQVMRRTKELENLDKIKQFSKTTDIDSASRMSYVLI